MNNLELYFLTPKLSAVTDCDATTPPSALLNRVKFLHCANTTYAQR